MTEKPHVSFTSVRTAAIVGRGRPAASVDALFQHGDYDVVVVESPDHAYSAIKSVAPDLIVVCIDYDDPQSCQVLSMLALDGATSRIPLLLVPAFNDDSCDDDLDTDLAPSSTASLNLSLN